MKKDTKEKRRYYPYKSVIRGKNSINGITLVALVVTIVVLLILAGITINYIIGEESVFSKAQQTKLEYEIAKAREKLEVTFGHAQILKHTEPKYNQDDYLDDLMKKEIPNIEIKDNIVIVDGFAFEIDRSVPKIGQYLGKKEELVFPEITVNATIADDSATATIHITAKEETNGINKIEVIQGGHVIKTYTYEKEKGQITENCVVKQNGIYTIRVYAKLTNKETVNVDGIMMSIEYTPNGNEEYKKEHQVKVTAKENDDKVKNIKYQWLDTTVEPEKDTFTESCTNGATLTKNGVTGSYYLWTLLETEKGKTRIERSEAFNFDNEEPNLTSFTATKYSETGITLRAVAQDDKSGIVKFEFFVDGVSKGIEEYTSTSSNITKEITVNDLSMGEHSCSVDIYDKLGNKTTMSILGKTKMHTWAQYYVIEKKEYSLYRVRSESGSWASSVNYYCGTGYSFNKDTGNITITGSKGITLKSWIELGVTRVYATGMGGYKLTEISGLSMNPDGNSCKATFTRYNVNSRVISTTKGSNKNSDVESISRSTYPDDGIKGSVWYVYKGVM